VALVRAIQESQVAAAADATNTNSTPAKIILVYFGGRPRLLSTMVDHATAVFVAFLPGPSAGDALVDLIQGHVNPSGRLPITYPKYNDASGLPYFHAVSDQCTKTDFDNPQPMPHYENVPCDVQWPFGHGLSYTTFAYSSLHVTGTVATGLDVSVDVENTGSRPGWEVVMVFTFDTFRSVTPEYKRLRAFEKIHLDASDGTNSKMTMHFKISSDDLRFVGPLDESHYIMDPSLDVIVGVSPNVDCRTNPKSDLCAKPYDSHRASNGKKASSTAPYSPACEAACDLWYQSGCLTELFHTSDKKKCLEMCGSVNQCTSTSHDNNAMPLTGATDGWGWNYVSCLESVVWGIKGSSSASQQCWKVTAICRDVFKTDQMNEFGIGPSSFSPHSSSLNPLSEFTTTNIVALCFGLVSSFMIFMLMRGSCFQKSRHGQQQRRRQGEEEYSAIQFTGTSTIESNGDHSVNDELNFT
jgi:beta-glucosidase